ncbi:hypothetical protein ACFQDF_27155 [Ectobacillus funiculus]
MICSCITIILPQKPEGLSSRMVGALVQEHRNTYRVKKEQQLSLLV